MIGAIVAVPVIMMDHQHEAGQIQQDVAHPPAALVDPGLVDEPDQGDDQLDGGQDDEDKICHYEMTTYGGAVQECEEKNFTPSIVIVTVGVIFTFAVIILTR